jgi:hypothetical protein
MSLQARVVAILTKPADEWRTIAAEPATVPGLMRSYAAPLAAITLMAEFIGLGLVWMPVVSRGAIPPGLVLIFAFPVVSWVFALVGAWIAAVVIKQLALTFQSRGNTAQALKLVVYSMTPVWVAGGVLYFVSPFAGLAGEAIRLLVLIPILYAVYLFYLGLPPVMSTPSDKVIPYMVVSALVIIVVAICLGAIATAILAIGPYRTPLTG